MTDKIAQLALIVHQSLAHGCMDGYCAVKGKAGGMHTNGGCQCLRDLHEYLLELAVELEAVRYRRGGTPCLHVRMYNEGGKDYSHVTRHLAGVRSGLNGVEL